MNNLSADAMAEKLKYDDLWKQPVYRVKSHGLDLWTTRRDLFPAEFDSVVDLGCGHGRFFATMIKEGKNAYGVDFDPAYLDPEIREKYGDRFFAQCLWELDMPGKYFDLGVSTDVMEHIPEAHVGEAIEHMSAHCAKMIYKIACHGSKSLGHDLHPTIKMSVGGWI